MPPPPRAKELLDSWKEIAVFLNRGVRTVQRWERDEDLPIHRHRHNRRGTVWAFASEVSAWLNTREGESQTPPTQFVTGSQVPEIASQKLRMSDDLLSTSEIVRARALSLMRNVRTSLDDLKMQVRLVRLSRANVEPLWARDLTVDNAAELSTAVEEAGNVKRPASVDFPSHSRSSFKSPKYGELQL